MDFKKTIVQSIYDYNDDYYRIESINEYISKITDPETEDIKYLVFEPSRIYTSIEDLMKLVTYLNDSTYTPENTLRIPFFAGCGSSDLSYFITGKNNITFSTNLEIKYGVLPSDFNISGLFRYFNYMSLLSNSYPVFNTKNSIENHIEYLIKEIQEKENINLVLPSKFLGLVPDEPFLSKIIKKIQEKEKG